MNEHDLNTCELQPGDRVILTNEGIEFHGDHLQDVVFTVDHVDEPDHNQETWVWFKTKDTKKLIGFERHYLTCEHETTEADPISRRAKMMANAIEERIKALPEDEREAAFSSMVPNVLERIKPKPYLQHVSEIGTYKEPESIMAHVSTEHGKGVTHYCEQLGGDNVTRINALKNKRPVLQSGRDFEVLDLLLMLGYENNALKDRIAKLEQIVKGIAHREQMREADDRPEESFEEDHTAEIEHNRIIREGLQRD